MEPRDREEGANYRSSHRRHLHPPAGQVRILSQSDDYRTWGRLSCPVYLTRHDVFIWITDTFARPWLCSFVSFIKWRFSITFVKKSLLSLYLMSYFSALKYSKSIVMWFRYSIVSGGEDGVVRVWSRQTGQQLTTITDHSYIGIHPVIKPRPGL